MYLTCINRCTCCVRTVLMPVHCIVPLYYVVSIDKPISKSSPLPRHPLRWKQFVQCCQNQINSDPSQVHHHRLAKHHPTHRFSESRRIHPHRSVDRSAFLFGWLNCTAVKKAPPIELVDHFKTTNCVREKKAKANKEKQQIRCIFPGVSLWDLRNIAKKCINETGEEEKKKSGGEASTFSETIPPPRPNWSNGTN